MNKNSKLHIIFPHDINKSYDFIGETLLSLGMEYVSDGYYVMETHEARFNFLLLEKCFLSITYIQTHSDIIRQALKMMYVEDADFLVRVLKSLLPLKGLFP